MKRNVLRILLILGVVFLFSQCVDDNDYSLGKFWISLGIVETEDTHGYAYSIVLDSGDTLLPVSTTFGGINPDEWNRVLVNYTLLGEAEKKPNLYYAKINTLRNVLFKEIIELTAENSDSIGNDPIKINEIWQKGSMLNVDFEYLGNYKTHYINLVIDENFSYTENEPVELLLRHNANNDDERYVLNGLVTFKLDSLFTFNSDSVSYVVKSTRYDNKIQTFHGTLKNIE